MRAPLDFTDGGRPAAHDIAIVGYAFKLPQDVDDDVAFWEVLENGRNLRSDFPESRINADSFVNSTHKKFPSQGGHFINEDIGAFDAPFFSVTREEAASMDPMQRWTLETSYRALEKAGMPAESLKGSRTAVFSASMLEDYSRMVAMDPENAERTAVTGSSVACIIPNRISWFFDLRGPSVHVNTACSGSLTAVDMACKTLESGDASCAIVTGSNLLIDPTIFQMLSSQGFLSPDSLCYSFDHRANGYARGEGVLALILKPVAAAVQNGDMIRAVIRSTGSNQDGHTAVLTQPSAKSQEELIRHVYKKANLPLNETRYVEAHGTGTLVGDPIEMRAIGRVFRKYRSSQEPLYVGSVKANIGHLEGASAMASIIKSILILEKGIIPQNALCEKVNPAIDTEFYHTEVPMHSVPWPTEGLRRISVNSFGFGGSNTHVILDDALHYMQENGLDGNHCTASSSGSTTHGEITTTMNGDSRANGHAHGNGTAYTNGSTPALKEGPIRDAVQVNGNGFLDKSSENGTASHTSGYTAPLNSAVSLPRLLVWAAADEKAVKRTVDIHATFCKENIRGDPIKLDRLAFTLAARRSQMLWRACEIVSASDTQGEEVLSSVKAIRSSADAGLAFVFTGQGAQYLGMGWDLIQYPVFLQTLRHIDSIYHSLGCDWSLLDELRHGKHINEPQYSQPLSTAVQIALVELLESFGITPKAVVGHSSGEIAAAYTLGALSLSSACKVAYFRGQLTGKLRADSSTPAGAMLSINVAEGQVPEYLNSIEEARNSHVTVACINSPQNCTLSGPESAIDAIKTQADKDGVFAQKLKTGVAYHSSQMRAIADEYYSLLDGLEGADPRKVKAAALIPMVSSVSGKAIRPATLKTAQYWVDNLVSPVRFSDAIQVLTQESSTLKVGLGSITDLVEIGPHPALRRPVNDTVQQAHNRKTQVRYESILQRGQSAIQTALGLVGRLFCLGHAVSIPAVNQQLADIKPPFLVDCPEYPFDRSNHYWAESRTSRDFRLRGTVKGEILGVRASDWNPLEPRWRNFLSVESLPWTKHHMITDKALLPAAGMLLMAIEATQEMIPRDQNVRGYLVKRADFISPIIVQKTREERTETQVRLRPIKGEHQKKESQFDIAIFSYSQGQWTECCNVLIEVESESMSDNSARQRFLADEDVRNQYKKASEICNRPLDSQIFYNEATQHGFQYGEMFQLLQDFRWDGRGTALARADVTKGGLDTTSLVHPAVLDQAFHVLRASAGQKASVNIPIRLVNAWFASTGWKNPSSGSIQWLAMSDPTTSSEQNAANGETGHVYALADDGTVLCAMEQAVTATISESIQEKSKKLLHSIEWKPQLSLLSPDQLAQLFSADTGKDESEMVTSFTKIYSTLDLVAVRVLKSLDRTVVPESLRRHVEWLGHYVGRLPSSTVSEAVAMNDATIESLLQECDAVLPDWKLYTTCARKLPEILAGKADPLEVVFQSDLADIFYNALFENMCNDGRLTRLFDWASHENPAMRILEVGAGTGGMTGHVLAALEERERRTGAPSFAEYSYTDVSPMFLERASSRWPHLQTQGRLVFKTFDMDQAVESQGFEPASYDMIIVASVLHATPDLEAAIRNLRKSLKPGGRLVLLETTKPEDIMTNFMAGLVPGWWVAREKWRPHSPAISEPLWDHCLRNNGFSGNDLVIRDYQRDECHLMSIILSTAVEQAPSVSEPDLGSGNLVFVVDEDQLSQQLQLAESVQNHLVLQRILPAAVYGFSTVEFRDKLAELTKDDIVVCLTEVCKPLLSTLSENDFATLRQLTQHAAKLVWVTAAATGDVNYPDRGIAQGFLRSIRAEQAGSHIVTVAIEGETHTAACAQLIAKAFEATFGSIPSKELEYIARDGLLLTGRAVEDVAGNDILQPLLSPKLERKPWVEGDALQLSVGTPGAPDSVRFVRDDTHETAFSANEIEIEAKAWALSELDVGSTTGRASAHSELLAGDCAGVVTRVGSNCKTSVQQGDRVFMSGAGQMRKYMRAHEAGVIRIPDGLSIEAATSSLRPGVTAYHALVDIARLEEGDKVLIHLAANSVGQIATRIAQKKGAHVYATTESSEGRDFLVNILGIPADCIFQSQDTSFAADVMRVTQGDGVDVIINSLVGEHMLRASCKCLTQGGHFIEISRANVAAGVALPIEVLARNITFSIVDPAKLRQKALGRLLTSATQLLEEGEIKHPQPLLTYSVSQVEDAFKQLQGKETIGRVVITARPEDAVLRPQWVFDSQASYLIAGGSGGLGRAIMQWMADRGAKHLIVPSRSGATSKAAASVLAQLTKRGVTVYAPRCDVSCETSFSDMLVECARVMPPIKGCINAAMVLQDGVFQQNMTFAKWDLTMKSKVQTSWNLHRLLPSDLDFFILLSSLAGIVGQMASSNYAGGCAFQDALARYRVSQGQEGLSIDIGWMRNIGIIAETGAYQRQRQAADDMNPIDSTDLLALLSVHCNPTRPRSVKPSPQVLIGLRTPADILAQGRSPPALLDRPLFAAFSYLPTSHASSGQGSKTQDKAAEIVAFFRQSPDSGERIQLVHQALAIKLARAMSIPPEDIMPNKPLSAYGVDSLMAVDLRNWFGKEFGATVAVFEIMGGVTISAIADLVATKSAFNKGS
ncbi:polyketide synthase [Aspergillus campestris IBT 28561]|uniref:Polyketide synthase n=1 Tax=Aspergillus campestris (strain IBT 28561) TaxID=1392248 RepID=A0A2I1CRN1_ASPC2|nr:polyketide synthase [Aspergillus campestris IBT 28561]PKY00277.1 polyketide synthase [Aspergillus campestris IBT 28561]